MPFFGGGKGRLIHHDAIITQDPQNAWLFSDGRIHPFASMAKLLAFASEYQIGIPS